MRSSFTTPATPELYTLSLHDALPISAAACYGLADPSHSENTQRAVMHVLPHQQIDAPLIPLARVRSEEHTSELQSHHDLVCRLLLEKKNNIHKYYSMSTIHKQHQVLN